MTVVELLRGEISANPKRFVVMAGLAGLSNAMVLGIINSAAGHVTDELNVRELVMFAAAIGLYLTSQKYITGFSAREVEMVMHRLRLRILSKLVRTDLLTLERLGRADVHAAMVRDTQTISQSAGLIVMAVQSSILIVFAMLYLLILSRTAFFLAVGFVVAATVYHRQRIAGLEAELKRANDLETVMIERVGEVLSGFKEVKMSPARRDDLTQAVESSSAEAAQVKAATGASAANEYVVAQALIYILLGVMVFITPIFSHIEPSVVTKITTVILFIVGPLGMMMQSLPALARSNAAAAAILDLDARLAQGAGEGTAETAQAQGPVLPPMESIALHHARFVHEDAQAQSSFILGPVNVVIERGQIVFINGGNGSGKSTLVKMLLGLYPLHEGTLRLNGRPVDSGELSAYREQFSAIFSDFQLFRTLYGLQNPDRMKCTELLELFELAAKVRLNGNRFDTVDLSSGQRKRLALVAALLEDRPVIVLDEWAADQDPEFRRKFYRELLPLLKQQGKTIIAVTHDDNYYDVADRRITLSEGRVAAES